jgi:NodT family efflux transporter outer membrane factor (OMF) lipoprotein
MTQVAFHRNSTPRSGGLALGARTFLLAGAAAAALSGCAAIPKLGPEPQAKAPTAYATAQTFDAPAAQWPQDRWWTAYGDAQLDGLIEEALAHSPDLVQAEARIRQAKAIAEQANSTLLPHLNAGGTIQGFKPSYNEGIPSGLAPHGWHDWEVVGVGLDWQIDFFGRNRALLAAATSEAEARRADAAEARLVLSTAIAGAYADLAQLYAERDAAHDAVRVRSESEALIAARFGRGLETDAALERAHSARAAAEEQLAALDESIGLSRNGLAALMGEGPDRGLAIARPGNAAVRPFGLPTNLPAELVGRRPDVVAARLTAQAAQKRIKAAKADFYPNVNLVALAGASSLGIGMLAKAGSGFASAGPAVSLPIFSAGRIEGAYRGARADYDTAVAVYDKTLVRAFQEVADSAVSARALDARLADSREALAAANKAYDLTRQRYARGLGTYLDVLSAEDALISQRRDVADLETRAFVLDVGLIRALGGGYRA